MRMRTQIFAVVALVSCLALVAGCVQAPIPTPADGAVRADEAADGTIVELTRGAKFVVALKANPTTGYDWKVIGELPSQLSVVGDSLESTAPAGVVGAGGTRVFTYRAEAAGTGALDLAYVRAWETGVPPERTFRLTVVVK